jgi:hypothetical protein
LLLAGVVVVAMAEETTKALEAELVVCVQVQLL